MKQDEIHDRTIFDYVKVLRRRRYQFLLPAIAVVAVASFVAVMLPDTYRSTATILIEDDAIPNDLLPSAVSTLATQRVQVIRQRILTTAKIAEIVDRLGLYGVTPGSDDRPPAAVLDGWFSEDMSLNLVSADIMDPRTGRPAQATIAFRLSFDSDDPEIAQSAAQELTRLFLEENVRSRASTAIETSGFLADESQRLNTELLALEARIAEFKAENEGAMPEFYRNNVSILERAEEELSSLTERIGQLQKRRLELSTDLSQLSPDAPIVLQSGEVVMGDRQRLESLLAEYRRKAASYSEDHPELARLRREIAPLREQLGISGESAETLRQQLSQTRAELAGLEGRYSSDHPQVVEARSAVAALEAELASASQSGAQPVPSNPAYLVVNTELRSVELEIRSAVARRAEVQDRIVKYEDLIRRGPDVEKQYQALQRDYATTSAKYQDLRARQQEAEIAKSVEARIVGGRFAVIEPPALPLNPVSPNRQAILLISVVLAGLLGIGTVVVLEVFDKSIHGASAVAAITGRRPLVVVPYLKSPVEAKASRIRNTTLAVAGSLAALGFVYLFISI